MWLPHHANPAPDAFGTMIPARFRAASPRAPLEPSTFRPVTSVSHVATSRTPPSGALRRSERNQSVFGVRSERTEACYVHRAAADSVLSLSFHQPPHRQLTLTLPHIRRDAPASQPPSHRRRCPRAAKWIEHRSVGPVQRFDARLDQSSRMACLLPACQRRALALL